MQLSSLDLSDADQARHVALFLDEQAGAHPFQYPGWAYASAAIGGEIEVLLGRQGGDIRFVATATRFPLLRRPAVKGVECRYGPVALDEVSLVAGLRGLVGWWDDPPVHLDAHPNIPVDAGERLARQLSSEGWRIAPVAGTSSSLVVELSDDEALLRSFRKTTRHEIVRARNGGVSIEPVADGDAFGQLHREMTARKGIPDQEPQLFSAVARWLGAEPLRGTILIAKGPTGEPIGGVVILRAGRCAWYTWGATKRVAGANAGHILQFEAMRWAREAGCTRYDLGGYEPGGPVATFKAGFSTTTVQSAPGLRRIIKGPRWLAYTTIQRLRGRGSS